MSQLRIIQGDWIQELGKLPNDSVHCCVTSPPYWGLRDYGMEGQLGMESSPREYIDKLVAGFEEVRRVLRGDGTLWLNLGDSYATGAGKVSQCPGGGPQGEQFRQHFGKHTPGSALAMSGLTQPNRMPIAGLKAKDLVGIPWRAAFALQAAGWYLRSDIIWHKPNPMPEGVTDRPTKAHEYIFLLTKNAKYFYDSDAIKEPPSPDLIKQIEDGYNGASTKEFSASGAQDASATKSRIIDGYRKRIDKQRGNSRRHAGFNDRWDKLTKQEQAICGRNKRSVWTVATSPYKGSHFATFPPDLIKPCILAGCPVGGTVLDPFGGSGTTGQVSLELGRRAILIELNPDYVSLIKQRTNVTTGLLLA